MKEGNRLRQEIPPKLADTVKIPFDSNSVMITQCDYRVVTVRAWYGVNMAPAMLRIYFPNPHQKGRFMREFMAYDRINRGSATWKSADATRKHESFAAPLDDYEDAPVNAAFTSKDLYTTQKIDRLKDNFTCQGLPIMPSKNIKYPAYIGCIPRLPDFVYGFKFTHQWFLGPNDWIPLAELNWKQFDIGDDHWGMILCEAAERIIRMHRERQVVHRAISAKSILVNPAIHPGSLNGIRVMLVNFEKALVPPTDECIASELYNCSGAFEAQKIWNEGKAADCAALLEICEELRWRDKARMARNREALQLQLSEH